MQTWRTVISLLLKNFDPFLSEAVRVLESFMSGSSSELLHFGEEAEQLFFCAHFRKRIAVNGNNKP